MEPADRATFEDFVRGRSQALLRTAYLLSPGDEQRAQDLVQTALAQTYGVRPRVRDHPNRDGYVRTALVRTSASWWRRRWTGESPAANPPERAVAAEVDRYANREIVLGALRPLPARQRAAVVPRFYDDLSLADTAVALGCSVGTVNGHTSRGLARPRELLSDEAPTRPSARSRHDH